MSQGTNANRRTYNLGFIKNHVDNRYTPQTIATLMQILTSVDLLLYDGIFCSDALYLFLYYITTAATTRHIEAQSRFAKSSICQIFGTICRVLLKWARHQICPVLPDDASIQQIQDVLEENGLNRAIASEDCIIDNELKHCSVLLDGCVFRLRGGKKNVGKRYKRQSWRAYKFKQKKGASVQSAVDHTKIVTYMSRCYPGSWHDMKCMKDCINDFRFATYNEQYDTVLADSGYTGLQRLIPTVEIIKKRAKNCQLSTEDHIHNTALASVHSKVERVFGELKSSYPILDMVKRGFDGTPEKFECLLTICVALYNQETRIRENMPYNF